MHEVHAALAIVALRRQFRKSDRLSEDEFYASYGEAPWQRLAKFSHAVVDRLARNEQTAQQPSAYHPECRLSKA
ncbi:hypothetical protein H6M51_02930 [Rhizobium sp. AQ_MP]|uniref:hypothetical protein n=1 Tax=Rhizobium sp. AQ_MP TaxID=2761536 RepID=UPI00163A0C92|nr:hypothetical protein [Rhizobium sp. AQ_MP]MBC2771798.1 hypothetical protein [Rhizobium sp. AQ_MP]